MVASANMILTQYEGFGWGITSPELPGLVGGRDSLEELQRDALDIAKFAGLDDDGQINIWFQSALEVEGSYFFVRVKNDYYLDQRAQIAENTEHDLAVSAGCRNYVGKDSLGDAVVIVGLPHETVNYLTETIEPNTPTAIATSLSGEDVVFVNVIRADASHAEGSDEIDVREHVDHMTLVELIATMRPAEGSDELTPAGSHQRSLALV